jgi:hypothetical protein
MTEVEIYRSILIFITGFFIGVVTTVGSLR